MGVFGGDIVEAADPTLDAAAHLDRLETIFRLAPLGIGIVDPGGHTVMANETLRLLLGYSAEEFAEMAWVDYTHPDDVHRNVDMYARMEAGETDQFSMEKRFICKDGRVLWVDLTSSMVRHHDGSPSYQIGMVQDITERKRLERDLRTAEQHYRLLVERVPAVVYIADAGPEAQWHYVSPQIEGMLGFTPQEWTGDSDLWMRQIHPDDLDAALAEEDRVLAAGGDVESHSHSYRMRHRDGSMIWVRDDAMALRDPDGSVTWHGVLVDVTREKQLEERLGHQAFHDPLTGLPNRRLFRERVASALARTEAEGGSVAVLFVDLDHFKTVNDSFGHEYGDKVIATAARRIKACVRASDTAARLGGDEFALLVEGSTIDEVEQLAARVLEALRASPMRLGNLTVSVAASVGIATAASDDTPDTLLRNADLAMYRAKRQGRGRHYRYHDGLHDEVVTRFRMEEALTLAIDAERITVVYQPIVDIDSGAVAGLEALARWTDPELGVVPPDQFVACAERIGLIGQLGEQVIRTACRDLARWRASTGTEPYVSVNVSPLQLDDDFPTLVGEVLDGAGLPGSALSLEVTEGVMLDERSRRPLHDVRHRGVRVALDDFGTGYSSLSYLRDLPVDVIKIDRMFLRPGPGGPADQTVLHALIRLADSLGLTAICEGVENHVQLADLQSAACGFAQGFYLCRPGPLDELPTTIDMVADRLDRSLF